MEKYDFKEEQKTKMVSGDSLIFLQKEKDFRIKEIMIIQYQLQYQAETLWDESKMN